MEMGLKIIFESDFNPKKLRVSLKTLIQKFLVLIMT